MTTPQQLLIDLEKANIYVRERDWKSDRAIFNLYCGLSITVYYLADTVIVRGKPKTYPRWNPVAALRAVLPADSLWAPSIK